ncbi:MAG TPA: FG-GAP-like repeat-containing protein [Chitinophagaceae bacterium]|jgi:hypothetical protein|nr:FG-GAP-like repeat-containing protein [Chitinophagaceae bacterium]
MKRTRKILLSLSFIGTCLLGLPNKHQGQTLLSESFEGTFPPAGWTLLNAGAGNNWSQNTNPAYSYSGVKCLQYAFNFGNPANTWIFSSPVNLTAGTTYRISYFYRGLNPIYDEKMKVGIGKGATIANQTTLLHDYPLINNAIYAEGVDYFIPSSSGNHNLSFNCYSPENQLALLIDSIVIKPAAVPSISSFSPKYGGVGETIVLTGFNFTGVTGVSFGGVPAASFTIDSPTQITAVVAAGGATGNVSVVNPFATASLAGFTYLTGLTFTPSSGPVGTPVTITGTGFDPVAANNTVFFGAGKAVVNSASSTSLQVTVPPGASHLPVTVNTSGTIKYSMLPFIVTIPNGGGGFLPTSFVPVLDTATGNNPKSVCAADFDGDGKIDVAVTNTNDNTISVFRNTTTGGVISFAGQQNFFAGTNPVMITTADIDGDNKPEILVANMNAASVSVFRNTGSPGTVSFAAKIDFTTGGSPVSIAAGDIDMDGKPDLAVVNYDNSNTVSVLRNTSTGSTITFAPRIDYITEQKPAWVAIGDLEGDGKPEVVVSTEYTYYTPFQHARVSVFKNNSTPGTLLFGTRVDYPTQDQGKRLNLVDFNVDGKLDISVQTPGAGNSVLRNTSTGSTISFAAKQDLGWVGSNVGIADLDGDGKPDLALENNFNFMMVLKNTSVASTFSVAAAQYYYTASPSSPGFSNSLNACIGDLDGDGKADIIVTNNLNGISVLKNKINEPNLQSFNPAGGNTGTVITLKGFKLGTTQSVSFGGVPAQSFTIISDTEITALVGAGGTGEIIVTTLYGTASIQRFVYPGIPVITSVSPEAGTVGAAVTINGNNFDPVPANNIVYFGAVKATVVSATTIALVVAVPAGIGYSPVTVTTNQVTAFSNKPFLVLFSGGGTAFTSTSFALRKDFSIGSSPSAPSPTGVITADMDLDGKPDIATANYTFNKGASVVRNLSSAADIFVSSPSVIQTGGYTLNTTAGDLDGDGKLDLIFTNNNQWTIGVLRNISSPSSVSFAPSKEFSTGSSPQDVAVGDINADGKPDMVVTNSGDNTFTVLKNTSTIPSAITFEAQAAISTGASTIPMGVYVTDVDGDGKPDIITANQSSNNVAVFRNTTVNGIISFAPVQYYASGSTPKDVVVADLNADGKPDIIVANQNSVMSVIRNMSNPGNLLFAAKVDYPVTGAVLYGIAANDIDGDGRPDIAVVSHNTSKASVFRNTSTGGTISLDPYVDYQLGNQSRSILLADIDMDGKPEIIATNYIGADISILRNQVGAAVRTILCPPVASTTLTSNISGTVYQWQVNTGSGFTNISDNANYTGTATATLQLVNIPSSWYGYEYRCVADGINSTSFVIIFQDSWIGGSGTAWENPANWSCGVVPDSNTDVIIHSGTVQVNASTTIRSLSLSPAVNFTVAPGITFTILH